MSLEEEYLTPEEIAKTLKVNPRTIQREIVRGELKAIKIGRQYRVSQSAFDAYLEKNTVNRKEWED